MFLAPLRNPRSNGRHIPAHCVDTHFSDCAMMSRLGWIVNFCQKRQRVVRVKVVAMCTHLPSHLPPDQGKYVKPLTLFPAALDGGSPAVYPHCIVYVFSNSTFQQRWERFCLVEQFASAVRLPVEGPGFEPRAGFFTLVSPSGSVRPIGKLRGQVHHSGPEGGVWAVQNSGNVGAVRNILDILNHQIT